MTTGGAVKRIATVLLVIVLFVITGASNAAAGTSLRIATLNLCGAVCLRGEVESTAVAVAAQARSLDLDAFVLNEVCGAQFDAMAAQLGAGWSAVFTTTTNHRPCRPASGVIDERFGSAILVRGTVGTQEVTPLPWGRAALGSRGREARSLLCAATTMRTRPVQLCAVHLSPDATDRLDQTAVVVAATRPLATAGDLVLAGDLNATADSATLAALRPYLGSTNPAHLTTSTGAVPQEIDWVLTTTAIPAPATTVADDAGGDHRWLIGTISP